MTRCEVLVQRARELGNENERIYGFCGQATIGAVMDTAGGIDPAVYKASTSLAGGACYACSACGAYTGGILCISSYAGREISDRLDESGRRWTCNQLCRKLYDKFIETYGTISCDGLQRFHVGRTFDLWIQEEKDKFIALGSHDTICPSICGNAAAWVVEILFDAGYIS